jgi:hypothetical protein
MLSRLRLLPLSAAALALVLVAAACGGSTPSTSAPATGTPTARPATATPRATATTTTAPTATDASPSPSGSGTSFLGGAAEALSDVDSYRFALDITGASAFPGASAPTLPSDDLKMSGTVVFEPEKALDFTIATSGLNLRYIVVGGDAWLDLGGGNTVPVPGGAQDAEQQFEALSPDKLFASVSGSLQGVEEVGEEQRNGVATTRYEADEATKAELAEQFESDSDVSMDVWVAKEGGYLVGFEMAGTSGTGGAAKPFGLKMDISNLDDPANVIERPS